MTGKLAGGGDVERRHETDRRRNFVRGEAVVADFKDLPPDVPQLAVFANGPGRSLQDHVSGDERTGHRTLLGPHHRHAYRRMPVDGRVDFLRIDLQAADVDHAAPWTEEGVAVAAASHHVAGVDEAVVAGDRGAVVAETAERLPRGTDAQAAIHDPD